MSAAERDDTAMPPPSTTAAPMRGWRLWLAVALLVVVAIVTSLAGRWQLLRADEKAALAQAIAVAQAQPPLALEAGVDDAELTTWREALATGAWQPGYTVLLDNRNHDGRPGYWVGSPLCLASLDAPEPAEGEGVDCDAAVLVLRGWLARGEPGAPAPEPPPPVPGATVQGQLMARVPRLFDLSAVTPGAATSDPVMAWEAGVPTVQNLTLDAYARATGLPLLPVVLEQRNDTGDGLARDWAGPAVETDRHLGYALQWFSFAAIALIALGVILVKAFRNKPR